MAKKEDIIKVIEIFEKNKKNHMNHIFDDMNKGAFAVLKFLSDNNFCSTSGEITDFMKISTARVAVILKKLEEKNVIVRTNDVKDARITVVSLTEFGKKLCMKKKLEHLEKIGLIIDEVGLDKLIEFNDTIIKINHIMKSEEKIFKETK